MRCKRGDIAVLVHPILPENAGLIVDVLAFDQLAGRWRVRPRTGGNRYRTAFPDGTSPTERDPGHECLCEDWRLQPIRGQKSPESIDTRASDLAEA
jgi:hypothetical protein